MRPVVYDAAVLIAADRNDRRVWADHRVCLEMGIAPAVPSTVVAQVSRSSRQAALRQLLKGCEVLPFRELDAHACGRILGRSRTSDVVDASVVATAVARGAAIHTGDRRDLEHLLAAIQAKVEIVDI